MIYVFIVELRIYSIYQVKSAKEVRFSGYGLLDTSFGFLRLN